MASGGPEFEFRNNTLYPIKVQADFFTKDKKDYIKITLLGTKTDDHYVKIVTELISTTPYEEELVETDTLAPGEQKVEQTPYTGYVVKTYRNVYAGDGTLLSSTYEATSRYKSRNRIILVGKAADPTVDPNVPKQWIRRCRGSDPGVPTTDPGATMTDRACRMSIRRRRRAIPETPQTSGDGAQGHKRKERSPPAAAEGSLIKCTSFPRELVHFCKCVQFCESMFSKLVVRRKRKCINSCKNRQIACFYERAGVQ